jgi:hypothetical protein
VPPLRRGGELDVGHDTVPDVLLCLLHELGEAEAERLGQVGRDGERRLPGTPLEQADVRPMHARAVGELVHGHAFLTTRVGD